MALPGARALSSNIPTECARCDKPFQPGEEICVVAFGHLEVSENRMLENARITDRTALCVACEDLISNTWPFLPGDERA